MSTGLAAASCTEDLGPCDTRTNGRDTVLVGGAVVQYGGQAIINSACANGTCHSSSAAGKTREGAPLGLDFDVVPIDESDAEGEDTNFRGDAIVELSRAQVYGLQLRQHIIYSHRFEIWRQVQGGLMPPPGRFAGYLQLKSIFDSKESEPCARGKRYESLSDPAAREVLRNWLACGSPLVEVNGSNVETKSAPGQAGFQYPMCGGSVPEDGSGIVVSLETLLDGPLATCANCHPGAEDPDLTDLEGTAATIESTTPVCNGKPYVTKGDPDQSFLYDVLSKDSPGCNVRRMPIGSRLTAEQLAQVRGWIEAGAPLTDADIESSEPSDEPSDEEADAGAAPPRDGGADAGRDAGRSDAGRRDAGG